MDCGSRRDGLARGEEVFDLTAEKRRELVRVVERDALEAARLDIADVLRRETRLSRAVHLRPSVQRERGGYSVPRLADINAPKLFELFVCHTE